MKDMTRYVLAFLAMLLVFPAVAGDVNLQISSITINNGLTHELSNDTSYFNNSGIKFGQNGSIKLMIGDATGTNAVNATIGAWVTNTNGSIYKTIIPNKTVYVPSGGSNSGVLVWVINQSYSLPTGRYSITAFVEFPKNNATNKTVYDTSEYINLVNLQYSNFYMKHTDKQFAVGDYIEFIHEVTNPGTITATPYEEVSFYFDSDRDGFEATDYITEDSTGGSTPIPAGASLNKTFVWNLTDNSFNTCPYSNTSNLWLIRAAMQNGFSYTGHPDYVTTYLNRTYIYNTTLEYAELSTPAMDYSEIAPGGLATALVNFENWGVSDIILHEAKAWIRYKDNGSEILFSISNYSERSYTGNGTFCPGDISQVTGKEQLAFNFPNLTLSPAYDYEVVMAFDYGVPRTDYISVNSFPYSGFNKQATAEFEFVEANLTHSYFTNEVTYSVNPNFTVEVENIGVNSIDLNPKTYLEIYNSTLGYWWNQSSNLVLAASSKANKTFGWAPTAGIVPLGAYTVMARYEYGLGGSTSRNATIKVVNFGINNVTSSTVAPYETTNVTFNIGNLGPTNATVTTLTAGIGSAPSISLGTTSNTVLTPAENKSFTYSYYFDPPTGLTNGSYEIQANLTFGGKTASDARENITLLPVGIKSYSPASQSSNETNFTTTLVLDNIANSSVSVTLNLSSNLSGGLNTTTVLLPANTSTTVNFNQNISLVGLHNLTITANYTDLPAVLIRSSSINISSQVADLSISASDISFSPSSPTTGQNVTISATVRNTGDASASSFTVELLINDTSRENQTKSVSANSSTVATFYWTAVAGTHNVSIVVDSTNAVSGETSETNNNATTSLTVSTPSTVTPSGGGGGSFVVTALEPSYLKSDRELMGANNIAGLIYESGDAKAATKYVIHPYYASLAGVLSANNEIVFSEEISEVLFNNYEGTKTGNVIKRKPALLEAGIYELAAEYVMNSGGADTLVISRGDVEADSLAASSFTNLIDGKMLLVKPGEVPYQTLQVLEKFRPTKVYIIGGENAISKDVEETIGKYAFTVERIGGRDRYETSMKLAREVQKMSDSTIAVVTDGEKPEMYSATLAVKLGSPVIYVDKSSPDEADELLKEYKVKAKLY